MDDLEILLCCDVVVFDSYCFEGCSHIFNLASRETIRVPKSRISLLNPRYSGSTVSVGFGYDLKNHQYKAIRIYASPDGFDSATYLLRMVYHAEMCTLGACSRREVKKDKLNNCFRSFEIDCFHEGFYLNLAIHWKGWYSDKGNFFIVLLNLGDEEFQIIQPPSDDTKSFQDFLVWNGSFALSITNTNYSLLVIFFMNEYGVKESWTKVFTIDIDRLRFARTLTIRRENEILLEIIDNEDKDYNFQLVSYNLRKQESKNLQLIHQYPVRSRLTAFVYMESLVPIRSRRESIA